MIWTCNGSLFWKRSFWTLWCVSVLTNATSWNYSHMAWALLVPWISSSHNTHPLFSSLISLLFLLGYWKRKMPLRVARICYSRQVLQALAFRESCEWLVAFWRKTGFSRNVVSSWAEIRSWARSALTMLILRVPSDREDRFTEQRQTSSLSPYRAGSLHIDLWSCHLDIHDTLLNPAASRKQETHSQMFSRHRIGTFFNHRYFICTISALG